MWPTTPPSSTEIQPFEERRAQVEEALFGSPPLVEDEAGDIVGLAAYSFLWPSAGSTHSLFLRELYVRDTLRRQGFGARVMDELRAVASQAPTNTRLPSTY